MTYQEFLNQQFIQMQNQQEDEKEALSAYRALVAKQPSAGFFEKERSFSDALKDPTSSQRDFFTGFGLALAASDSTNSLSSRIAGAIGVGKKAMDTRRENELTREQALARLDLENFKVARANRSSLIDLKGKQETERRAKQAENIRLRQDEQLQSRDGLSVDQFQENRSIIGDRKFVDSLQDVTIETGEGQNINILSPEALGIIRQARTIADAGPPEEYENLIQGNLKQIFKERFGAKTIPNILYNKAFVDRIDNAAKNLNSATGEIDENREKYATLATGLGGKIQDAKRTTYLNSDQGKKDFIALKKRIEKEAKANNQAVPSDEDIKNALLKQKGFI